MTLIESAIFDEGWQENLGVTYEQLLWPSTGEILNKTSFEKYRTWDFFKICIKKINFNLKILFVKNN